MPKVFISDAVHHERLPFEAGPSSASPTRQRWRQLSALYQASLAACQITVEMVLRPEIYQTELARQVVGVGDGDWHLAIKPIEHIRPFHGIPNVVVCDWPFSELSSSRHGGSPFSDQVGLLNKADAVACCTPFTAQSLRDAGVERVVVLPPYIPMRTGMISRRARPDRRTFLTVAEVDRLPRQLGPIIRGFAQAHAHHNNLHLIVRVMGDGRQSNAAVQHEVLGSLGLTASNEGISFLFDTDNDAGIGDMFGSVDFFLSCAFAGALSLPAIEAMMAGVPILTTLSSGTGSFLTPGSAVPISAVTVDEIDQPLARYMKLTCEIPTAEGVRNAILAAVALDDATQTKMITECQHIADRHFGLAAFEAGLANVEEHLGLRHR